jgi:adenine-specific DNA-methyltransferase
MNEGFTIESLIFSFYNTLTLLAAEMQGRFYGGGVLELTPNEFKNLPIPYTICDDFNDFSNMFERKMSIEEVLNINDKIILIDGMGLTDSDVSRLQTSYKKMKSRRMRV